MSDTVTEARPKVEFSDSWYYHDITHLPEPTLHLFEKYSGVPSEQIIDHIQGLVRTPFPLSMHPVFLCSFR